MAPVAGVAVAKTTLFLIALVPATTILVIVNEAAAFSPPLSPAGKIRIMTTGGGIIDAAAASSSSTALALKQYAPDAVSLFNNMKTPASILAGGLVPLGMISPLPPATPSERAKESRLKRAVRLSYGFVAVLSLMSELVSVMWATVAVNQLTETKVAKAESVWYVRILQASKVSCDFRMPACCLLHIRRRKRDTVLYVNLMLNVHVRASILANILILRFFSSRDNSFFPLYRHLLRRDYDIPWLGTNAHFVAGMLGFSYLVAVRSYFAATSITGGNCIGIGTPGTRLAAAGFCLMLAIVNRGVASGSGNLVVEGKGGSGDGVTRMRYGSNILFLFINYGTKLMKRACSPATFGPLELASGVLLAWGTYTTVLALWNGSKEDCSSSSE